MKKFPYQWKIEPYDWGQIGRLKTKYRNRRARERTINEHFIMFSKNNIDKDTGKDKYRYWPFGRNADVKARAKFARTKLFELKYWSFPVGSKSHEKKINLWVIEYNFIVEGETEGEVGGGKVSLKAGDYIIIKPGFLINLQSNIKRDLIGITIKFPYLPEDDDKITKKDFKRIKKENELTGLIKANKFKKIFTGSKK